MSPEARARQWLRLRLDPAERYGLRTTLFAVAFALVAVPFGLLVAQVRGEGRLVDVDTAGLDRLHRWVRTSPGVVGPLKAVSDLGTPIWLWLVVTVATVVLLRAGRPRLVVFLLVTVLVGSLLDTVVKLAVDRPRPFLVDPVAHARGKSFPSGHAMSSTVVYGSLLLVFLPGIARRWRPVLVSGAIGLVLAIAFTRLALGVHYLSDVVGGVVLGLAWLAVSTAAFSIWRVERGRRPVQPMEGLEPEAAADLPGSVEKEITT
jgi:membrane-associated phospholipid phosphatase